MLTKTDFIELEKRFVTREIFFKAISEIMEFLTEFRKEVNEFRLDVSEKFEETHEMLENHGRRVEKLEDKVLS